MATVKKLDKTIVKRGFELKQIQRKGNIAIYSKKLQDEDVIVSYETIKIKAGLPHPNSKSTFDKVEYYPSDEQFGLNGWSYGNYGDLSKALQKATQKFNELTNTH